MNMRSSGGVARAVDPVTRYALDVVDGKTVTGRLVRLACERHLKDLEGGHERGLFFDPDAAQHALDFFNYLRHSKGEWAGAIIELEPWQQFRIGSVFGWMREDPETGEAGRRFRTAYNEVARKNGKALALDTPIPTPSGWKRMGEIAPGDLVFGRDGKPVRVVATSPIFLNHDCYEVTFEDGEAIIADGDHLWTVVTKNSRRLANREVRNPKRVRKNYKETDGHFTITTREMVNDYVRVRSDGRGAEYKYRVPMNSAVEYPEKELPIHPYVLGVWLGDGHSDCARVTSGVRDAKEIAEHLRACGVEFSVSEYTPRRAYIFNLGSSRVPGVKNPILDALRELNLIGNKHIPRIYLESSIEQRMELLRGLMDTDGFVEKRGQCEFVQSNRRLVEDFSELLASLGIKHTVREKTARCNGREVGSVYSVLFFVDQTRSCFKLQRKHQRLKPALAPRMNYKSIVSIRRVDSVPVRCISVDAEDKLYLAGKRMTVTHNSTESAGIGLYMLDADGEPGAEIYSAATKRDQARIVWEEASRMVQRSPALSKRIRTLRSNMHVLETASKFEPLGADADSLDGLNIHGAIIDELHAHKTREVWDVLETATGARRQPLIWAITTAGFDQTGICYELREYSIEVLEGRVQDDTWFAYIATIDESDDPFDESVWIKANPNLGVSVKWDDMRRLAKKAEQLPTALNNFLTKRLNVWTQQETRWIPLDIWDENAGETPAKELEERLKGVTCYGGLDLGSVSDLSAWVMVFPWPDSDDLDVIARFWCPETRLYDEENRYRYQYQAWAREGWLTATPGRAIDYGFIKQQIIRDATQYGLVDFNVDRLFQAHQLSVELIDEGLTVVGMGQGFVSMAAPMSEFERRLLHGQIHHGNNPVLRWMAGNVAVKQDAAGNLKPDKATSQGKIDGIVALVMALDRAMRHEAPSTSVYAERGVR